eukprot:PRCOL_00001625-RA
MSSQVLGSDFFTEYGEMQRYTIHEVMGKGSYGVVVSATDNHTGQKVAIKRINDVFEHVSDATRILREIKLLRLLKHPDIVEIKHIMLPPHKKEFRDIYVVFELMETDLHQARNFLRNMKHKPGIDFRYKFPNASPEIRAILAKLLAFDPNDRIGAAEALADPFFASLTDPGREEGRDPISKVEFAFEAKKLTMENIKELIYREILEYHPNMLEEYERGGNSSSFMYPSAVDRFRQQFMNLEAGGRASLASSARAGGRRLGNSASLPRQSMEKLYKEFEAEEQDGQ